MSRLTVYDSKLHGEISLPVSKSEAHRAVICSSLARNGIDALDLGSETALPDDILVTRKAMNDLLSDEHMIFCGESGSTLRFLIPIAAALGKNVIFTGAGRLPLRPLKEYAQAFSDNGAILKFPENDSQYLPLEVKGRLRPGIYKLPGNVSSQYVSGLLMSLPLLNAESRIIITSGLESSGYVDMTVEVMSEFGVKVTRSGNDFIIEGEQTYKDIDYTVEGDYSAAAFWIVANYLGGDIKLRGLHSSSTQGDKKITDIIDYFSDLRKAKRSCIVDCPSPSVVIDASDIPDLVPVLCVAAAATDAVTEIRKASRLRFKESDRIASTVAMIRSIGGVAEETPDGIRISGRDELFRGGHVDSFSDHRIAMAAAIAGTFSRNGVSISDHKCTAKSYPRFFEDLIRSGGVVHGFSDRK